MDDEIRGFQEAGDGGFEWMSLDSLPNLSLNLADICKLDLSNNNLQTCTPISSSLSQYYPYKMEKDT
ncbi:hypothetical protein AAHA92_33967 [Salvia divinorum]|uniref:Uncharacterized protein n=1 Tax=Salvia divinorum TaxID=28513 RepID=A0ABD1FHE8_SALDI